MGEVLRQESCSVLRKPPLTSRWRMGPSEQKHGVKPAQHLGPAGQEKVTSGWSAGRVGRLTALGRPPNILVASSCCAVGVSFLRFLVSVLRGVTRKLEIAVPRLRSRSAWWEL